MTFILPDSLLIGYPLLRAAADEVAVAVAVVDFRDVGPELRLGDPAEREGRFPARVGVRPLAGDLHGRVRSVAHDVVLLSGGRFALALDVHERLHETIHFGLGLRLRGRCRRSRCRSRV